MKSSPSERDSVSRHRARTLKGDVSDPRPARPSGSRNVLIADESEILRVGLRQVLEARPGWSVAAEAGDGQVALRAALQVRPQLLVLDTQLPVLSGSEVAGRVVAADIHTKVIAFTTQTDRFSIVQMLKAGALGYVLKSSTASELLRAIDAVTRGHTYLSPSIAGVVSGLATREDRGADLKRAEDYLSTRETEVLKAIALGKQNKEIADALQVTVRTVESHRSQLMKKLNLRSVAALTKYAIREGLATVEH